MGSNEFKACLVNIQENMLNYAFILTSNREDAFDLVQDTTLKALDNRLQYTDNVNFKGWIFTIMRNLFINNYRRSSRASFIGYDTSLQDKIERENAPEVERPDGALTLVEINDAVNEFPEEYRLPFSMHAAGYKYHEIAERMKLPMGTVKSRIFSARKRLQTKFCNYL